MSDKTSRFKSLNMGIVGILREHVALINGEEGVAVSNFVSSLTLMLECLTLLLKLWPFVPVTANSHFDQKN